ncbi:DUF5872 domain-containing protein [Micromonospora sp. CA-249363]|uniref:DUF5872 domain-containing protein n=1 Tax=Micromonospora sp. CA-249363 TaxID=3239963 RepID=UPI003D8B8698
MARYTKPELREQIKEEIKASDKGGRPGQWSARKSQLVTQEYKRRGGGFLGEKDERQKALQRWGNEKWQTKEGDARARKDGTTSRYLPKKAWDEMSESQKRATDTKKREASRTGRQYVANTGPAKKARRDATTAGRISEMSVAEASKLVRGMDTRQLRTALRNEHAGKDRKTLVQRLEAELNRRGQPSRSPSR